LHIPIIVIGRQFNPELIVEIMKNIVSAAAARAVNDTVIANLRGGSDKRPHYPWQVVHVFRSGKSEIQAAAAGFTRAHKLALRAFRESPMKGIILEVRIIGNRELAPTKYQDEFRPMKDARGITRDCLVLRAA